MEGPRDHALKSASAQCQIQFGAHDANFHQRWSSNGSPSLTRRSSFRRPACLAPRPISQSLFRNFRQILRPSGRDGGGRRYFHDTFAGDRLGPPDAGRPSGTALRTRGLVQVSKSSRERTPIALVVHSSGRVGCAFRARFGERCRYPLQRATALTLLGASHIRVVVVYCRVIPIPVCWLLPAACAFSPCR